MRWIDNWVSPCVELILRLDSSSDGSSSSSSSNTFFSSADLLLLLESELAVIIETIKFVVVWFLVISVFHGND